MSFLPRNIVARNCCKCNNSPNLSISKMLRNIRSSRFDKQYEGEALEDYAKRNTLSWYKNARKQDKTMAGILITSGLIVGGILSSYIQFKEAEKDGNEYRRRLDIITEYFVSGSFIGSMLGTTLWVLYPFPKLMIGTVGLGLYFTLGPSFLFNYLYKKQTQK